MDKVHVPLLDEDAPKNYERSMQRQRMAIFSVGLLAALSLLIAGITFVRASTLYDEVDSLQKTPEFLKFLQATRDANISTGAPGKEGSADWLHSLIFKVDRTLLQHLVTTKSQISNLRGQGGEESEAIQQLRARLGQVSETLKVLGVAEQATGARLSKFEAQEKHDVNAQFDAVRSGLAQQADEEAGIDRSVQDLATAVNRTEHREEALQRLRTEVSQVSEALKTLGDAQQASGVRIDELKAHETGDIDTRLGGVEAGLAREAEAEANISRAVERLFGMERQARHTEHALNASEALQQLSARIGGVSDALSMVKTSQRASVAHIMEIATQQKEDTDSRFEEVHRSIADQAGEEANASEAMQDLRTEVHKTELREQALEQLSAHVDELSEALKGLDSAQNASDLRITDLELYQRHDINKHFDEIQGRLAGQMDEEAKLNEVVGALMVKVRKAAHLERGLNVSKSFRGLLTHVGQIAEALHTLGEAQRASDARFKEYEAQQRREIDSDFEDVHSNLAGQGETETNLSKAMQSLVTEVHETERREQALQRLSAQVDQMSGFLGDLDSAQNASAGRISDLETHEKRDIDVQLEHLQGVLAKETEKEANLSAAMQTLMMKVHQVKLKEHKLNASAALQLLNSRISQVSESLKALGEGQRASFARIDGLEAQEEQATDSHFSDVRSALAGQAEQAANLSGAMQSLMTQVRQTRRREEALERLRAQVSQVSGNLQALEGEENASGARIDEFVIHEKRSVDARLGDVQARLSREATKEANLTEAVETLMTKMRQVRRKEHELNASKALQRLNAQVGQLSQALSVLDKAQTASDARLGAFEVQEERDAESRFSGLQSRLADEKGEESNLSANVGDLATQVLQTEQREQALEKLSAQVEQVSGTLADVESEQNASGIRASAFEAREKRSVDHQLGDVQARLAGEVEKEGNLTQAVRTLMLKMHEAERREHDLNATVALQHLNALVGQLSESLSALDSAQSASIARIDAFDAKQARDTDSRFQDVRAGLAEKTEREANLSKAMQDLAMEVNRTEQRAQALQQLTGQVGQASSRLGALEDAQNASGARISELEAHQQRDIDTQLGDLQAHLANVTGQEAGVGKAVQALMARMHQAERRERGLNATQTEALQELNARVSQVFETLKVVDGAQRASGARISEYEAQQKNATDSQFGDVHSSLAKEEEEEASLSRAMEGLVTEVHETEDREQALQQLSAQVGEVSGSLASLEREQNASGARVSDFEAREKRDTDARIGDVQDQLAKEVERESSLNTAVQALMTRMSQVRRKERELNASAALQALNARIDNVSANLRVLGGAQRTSDAQLGEFEAQEQHAIDARFSDVQASLAKQIATEANLSSAMQGLSEEVRQTERGEEALQQLDARFSRASETLKLLGRAENASGARISELEAHQKSDIDASLGSLQEGLARETERGAGLGEAMQAMAAKLHWMRLQEQDLNASESLRSLGAQVSQLSEALGALDDAQNASIARIAGLEAQRAHDVETRFGGIQLTLAQQVDKEANLSGAVQGLVTEVHQVQRREHALLQLHGQVDKVSETLRALSSAQNASGARIGELEANEVRDVDARLTNLQARLAQEAEQETNINEKVQILMASMRQVRHEEKGLNATEALQLLSARVDGVSEGLTALGSAQEASSARIGEAEAQQKRDVDGRFSSIEQSLAEQVARETNLSMATQRLGTEVDQAERREQALEQLSAQVSQVSGALKALDDAQRADGARVDDLESHQKSVVDAQLSSLQARLAEETDKETGLSTAMQALMAKVHEARRRERDLNATEALQALNARVERVSENLRGLGEAQHATSAEISELEARETRGNATHLGDVHV